MTNDPLPQCLQTSPLTPFLLAQGTSDEVGAISQMLSVSALLVISAALLAIVLMPNIRAKREEAFQE